MPAIVSLLRGVNVGGRTISMSGLRDLYTSLGLEDVQSYVQSGNLVFRTRARDLKKLAMKLEDAIEGMAGFRSVIALRDTANLREVVARNPFAGRADVLPNRLHVHFLCGDPSTEAPSSITALNDAFPEELHLTGRELYVNYPEGAGRSKLTPARLDKALGTPSTARNWNTVTKLLEMAERLDRL
jgi:uncharacterized protein (DUF1697 family)